MSYPGWGPVINWQTRDGITVRHVIVDYGKGRSALEGLPRYGVWKKTSEGHLIGLLEQGEDWAELQQKYAVANDDLHLVG